MPAGYLRIPPEGQYVGKPPVLATPNLASLICAASGENNRFAFTAANMIGRYSAPGTGLDIPVVLRPGYRYNVVAAFSVDQTSETVSHLLQPKWNRQVASTHAYEGVDTFGPGSMSSPNDHVNSTTMSEINTVVFMSPTFTPVVEYEAIQLSLTSLDGILAGLFIRHSEAWVQVWERGGVLP